MTWNQNHIFHTDLEITIAATKKQTLSPLQKFFASFFFVFDKENKLDEKRPNTEWISGN